MDTSLCELRDQMRLKADAYPDDDKIVEFARITVVDGQRVSVILTKTVIGERQFYQFSVGNESGNPRLIGQSVINKLKAIFVPKCVPLPSVIGNCIQFLEEI